jgi:hypothetical protein
VLGARNARGVEIPIWDLTLITIAGSAVPWGCDLVVRCLAGADLCTRRRVVGCCRGVCPHGEDQFWGDGGADRVVVLAGVTLD